MEDNDPFALLEDAALAYALSPLLAELMQAAKARCSDVCHDLLEQIFDKGMLAVYLVLAEVAATFKENIQGGGRVREQEIWDEKNGRVLKAEEAPARYVFAARFISATCDDDNARAARLWLEQVEGGDTVASDAAAAIVSMYAGGIHEMAAPTEKEDSNGQ